MRTRSFVRRALALTTVTALMTGGLAGALSSPASAASLLPTPDIHSVSPISW